MTTKDIFKRILDKLNIISEDRIEQQKLINTMFNEKKVVNRNQQFILNANVPLSNQRDLETTQNNGSVQQIGPGYRLRATSDTDSLARLSTQLKGNYISGNISEVGLGIISDSEPSGDAYLRWGAYDPNNLTGPYFELDSEGLWAVFADNGSVIDKFKKSTWNIEDFTGVGKTLDLSDGHLFEFTYGYYGFTPFVWGIAEGTNIDNYRVTPAHFYRRRGTLSLVNPNLPITVEAFSGSSGEQLDITVGGRQYSTYGNNVPTARDEGTYVNKTVGSANFVPLIAVRGKSGLSQIVKYFSDITVVPNNPGIWRIVKGDAPTGGTWEEPKGYNGNETCMEFDTTATTIGSSTETIKSGIFGGSNQAQNPTNESIPRKQLFDNTVYTLEAIAKSQDIDILVHLDMKGLW